MRHTEELSLQLISLRNSCTYSVLHRLNERVLTVERQLDDLDTQEVLQRLQEVEGNCDTLGNDYRYFEYRLECAEQRLNDWKHRLSNADHQLGNVEQERGSAEFMHDYE